MAATRRVSICFLAILSVIIATVTHALPRDPLFEELKARYLKLRNTDTAVSKVSEWRAIGDDLSQYAWRQKSSNAPRALFDASIVHERLFDVLGDKALLERSIREARAIVERYPADLLADDALLRIGDLQASKQNDREAARAAYQQALKGYPKGDATEIARARLRQMDGKSVAIRKQSPQDLLRSDAPLVVIDPGHGGEDLGAEGMSGLYEKDIVLDVGFELERLLTQNKVARVRLTRRVDTFVPLADRTAFANDLEATVFISLHSNASPTQKLSGIQTFYLDVAGDEASRLLAERENADARGNAQNADLDFILSDLVQSSKIDDSVRLAAVVHKELAGALTKSKWKVPDLGIRKAPFYVLVGAHMPCILVEMLFVNNPGDAKRLSDKQFRKEIARGLFNGISRFLSSRGSSRG